MRKGISLIEWLWFISIITFSLLIGSQLFAQPQNDWADLAQRLGSSRSPQSRAALPSLPAAAHTPRTNVPGEVLFEISPPDANVVSYSVYRGGERGYYTNVVKATMPSATTPRITVRLTGLYDLTNSGTYYFAVRAFNAAGNGSEYFPPLGLRHPPVYKDQLEIERNPTLQDSEWTTLLIIPGLFTNAGDSYRLKAVRYIEP